MQIFVGENNDQKTFQTRKKILCGRIPHFAQLLKDSHKSIIDYPQVDPNDFNILLEWVHTDYVRGTCVRIAPEVIHRLWCHEALHLLADYLCLPKLMDRVMEVLQRFGYSTNTCYKPDIEGSDIIVHE